jgi:hypothetical protein
MLSPRTPLRDATLAALFASLLSLFACGGGSGTAPAASAPPSTGGSALLVDGRAGSNDVLSVIVSSVAFEDAAGNPTPNLLPASEELVISDGVARFRGLDLQAPPRASYRAVQLVLHPGSARLRPQSGGEELVAAPQQLRVPLDAVRELGDGCLLVLRHQGPLQLQRNGTGPLTWTPSFAPLETQPEYVADAEARVLAVSQTRQWAWVELSGLEQLVVRLEFGPESVLVRDSDQLVDVGTFLAGLREDSRIFVEGRLDAQHVLQVSYAEDLSWLASPSNNMGVKTKVLGTILSVDTQQGTITLNVQEVLRHGRGPLPPRQVEVYAAEAKIKWRSPQAKTPQHVPFTTLAKDMLIEAEWKTPEVYGVPSTPKIRIRAEK